MDDKVKEYRRKHKRCIYCKYRQFHPYSTYYGVIIKSWYECKLSNKEISFPRAIRICKYYEVDENKND